MINKFETSVFQLILHIHNEVIDRSDSSYVLSDNLFIYYIYDSSIKIKSSSMGYSISFNEENKTFAKCSLLKKYVPNTELLNIVGRIIIGKKFPFRIKELKATPVIDYAIFDSNKTVRFFDKFIYEVNQTKYSQDIVEVEYSIEPKKSSEFSIDQWINEDEVNLFDIVESKLRTEYLGLNTGVKEIDYLLSSVLKDNVITVVEERFLLQKLKENDLQVEVLEKAKEFLNNSNPYLDGIIHIIYDDLKITSEELRFLNEKCLENSIPIDIAIMRFWQIGFIYYPSALSSIPNYFFWLKLLFIISKMEEIEFEYIYLNIFSKDSIEEVIDIAFNQELQYFKNKSGIEDLISIDNILSILNIEIVSEDVLEKFDKVQVSKLRQILEEEKRRIGTPDAALFCENIIFRLGI